MRRKAKLENPDHEHLFRDLLHAVYWFDDALQAHLEAAGWPTVSRTKSLILTNVSNGVRRPIEIAKNLGLTRQAVHVALGELEAEKIIETVADPDDRRAKIVRFHADQRGEEIRNVSLASLHRIEAVLKKRLGKDLFEKMSEALRKDWQDPPNPDEPIDRDTN